MVKRTALPAYERAEDYLYRDVLPAREAWPEHYREAEDQAGDLLDSFLGPAQSDELVGALGVQMAAGEGFHLRIGFELGQRFALAGTITQADVCAAVLEAGGNPGRALADIVEADLAEVIALPGARA
jgi:hypothetical protein